MFTVSVRRTEPVPSQAGHGSVMIVPWPPQFPQVFAIEKNPCWKRIWPVPRHCGQARGAVPRRVPRPPHCSQGLSRGSEIVRSQPRAASSKLSSRRYWRSWPRRARPRLARVRPVPKKSPKRSPRMSSKPAVKSKPAPTPPGSNAAWPKRSYCARRSVGEHLVGFADLLEALLRLAPRLGVPVGVPLERELAVGLLDLLLGRGTGDTQHLVVVALHRGRG